MNESSMGPIRIGPLAEDYKQLIRSQEVLAQSAEEEHKELFDRVSKAWDRIVALSDLAEVITPTPIDGVTLPTLIDAPHKPVDKRNVRVPSDWNYKKIQSAGENHGSVVLRLAVEYGNLTRGDIQAYNRALKEIDDHHSQAIIYRGKLHGLERVSERLKSVFQEDELV